MRVVDLSYVLGGTRCPSPEDIQVLSGMLVQKDSANVLVNIHTKAAIMFREREMIKEQGDIYVEDYDVFTRSFYEKFYREDDLANLLKITRIDYVVEKLKETKYLEFSYSLYDENGEARRKFLTHQMVPGYEELLCICNHDITTAFREEKRNESVIKEALALAQRASQAKSDFLVRLSTDLRSPIFSITNLADRALECNDLNQMKEYLMQIKRKSVKFTHNINTMMNLSVVDKGELEVKLKPVVLKNILDDIAYALEPLAKQRGVSLTIEVNSPMLPVIMMDPMIMKEGFIGLLINAIEYGKKGGNVKLQIDSNFIDENHVEAICTVSDDGPGMEEEYIQKLGQEFFTGLERRNTMDALGLGLGIPLTQAFVDRFGGTMKIESELGTGTKITICIMVERADVKEEYYLNEFERMKLNAGRESFSRFRAIVADHDDINRKMTELLLRKIGLNVESAENCQEVIDKLVHSDENYYHIVFMDVNMINLDGRTATMTIRELDRLDLSDITIVGTTGYALRDERIRTLESGMDYHLPIPIDEGMLKDILLRELFNLNPQKESETRGFRIVK